MGLEPDADRHMIDFRLITPATLRQHWPRILSSLCVVRAKNNTDWIAEDVYHAIKSGESACHLAYDGEDYIGLLVTKLSTAEYSGTRSLFVWIAHNAGSSDVLESGLPVLREMAKRANAQRITFGSPRPGWAKRFPLITAMYEVPL